jgi:glycosyltransferase involved in cell wall biosynthesis
MLRVLTLSTLYPHAGKPTFGAFVERQTKGLAGLEGVEVEVVAPVGLPIWPLYLHPRYRAGSRLPLEEHWNGLKVHRPRFPIIPRFGSRRSAHALASSLLPMLRRIKARFKFDVINAQFFWPDGPAAMHLARALEVPFSITARGSDIQYWMHRRGVREQILEAGRSADGMLAVSAALRQVMVDFGLPADRIMTHYTGVDHERFRPVDRAQAKARLGVEGPLILTAAALIPGKGQRLAVAAVEQLPGATLLLAGEGPDRRALEAMVRKKGLGDRVRLLGSRPHSEVAELMAAADVMLLPSRSEGLANVWVEALSSGTPVVTCDVGGAREVIDRPEAGALVAPDADAIAAAIRSIVSNPPEQELVRAAAERFSPAVNSRGLFDHLSGIVAARKLS